MRYPRGAGATLAFAACAVAASCVAYSEQAATPDEPGLDSGATAETEAGSRDDGGDGRTDSGSSGPCARELPFGDPVLVLGGVNSVFGESGASLTSDELLIYFAADAPRHDGGTFLDSEIYFARRDSRSEPFGAAVVDATLRAFAIDLRPSLDANGTEIVFASSRTSADLGGHLWRATRPSRAVEFGEPQRLQQLYVQQLQDYDPFVTEDGLLFTRGASDRQLFAALRGSNDFTGASSAAFAKVNALAGNKSSPVMTRDGLTLYFSNTAPPATTSDIWAATRASKTASFDAPALVPKLSSSATDQPAWISDDGCRLYITTTRSNGVGGSDIWVVEKPPR